MGLTQGLHKLENFTCFFPRHATASPSCMYLAIRQLVDSLMTCVRVTHTFALSSDKVCLFGLCRNLLTEINITRLISNGI